MGNVKKGLRVLFSDFAGTERTLDGTAHWIRTEANVLGITK